MNEIMTEMQREVSRNFLRWHVGQTLFCPKCRRCLDCRSAVSVELANGDMGCMCSKCWDGLQTHFKCVKEVVDGRDLWPPVAKSSAPVVHNPVHAKDVVVGGRYRTNQGLTVRVVGRKEDYYTKRLHYVCVNERTGRTITVKSAAKFRCAVGTN